MFNKRLMCLLVLICIVTSTTLSYSHVFAKDNQDIEITSRSFKSTRAQGDISIDDSSFPDSVFRDWIKENTDANKDDVLTQIEMDAMINVSLNKKGIMSLEGIKNFKNISSLTCKENQLTHLDLSGMGQLRNLVVDKNNLITLDVSNTPRLELLSANENQLTSVNMDQAVKLSEVNLNSNPLTIIDFTDNVALNQLSMRYTKLTNIDLSQNIALQYLTLSNNDLTSIDLTHNTELLDITLSNFDKDTSTVVNRLESVDVSHCPKLKNFRVAGNKIKEFDLTHNPEIKTVYLNDNQIKSADLSMNTLLTYLELKDNELTSVNVNGLSGDIYLSNNQLENIDISSNTNLSKLDVSKNKFKTIDLHANKNLKTLYISDNQIENLDVKENVNLETLRVENCLLKTLDLKTNTKLRYLYAAGNALSMLDLSSHTSLSRDNLGTQKIEFGLLIKNNGQYTFDLSSILPKKELANVVVTNATSYDQNTGIATYDTLPIDNIIQYTYDTKKYPMKVDVITKTAFSVMFDSQGGMDIPSKNIIEGNTIVNQNTPKREGYIFKGWYKEKECINQWDFSSDTVTSDTTLYAKWEKEPTEIKYKVIFDFMDGHFSGNENPSLEIVVKGDEHITSYPSDTLMTKEGYTFKGWYKEKECINQWNFSSDTVISDTTLYALWQEVTVDVPSDDPTPAQPNKKPENKPNTETSDNVKTSDNSQVGQYIILVTICLLVPVCLKCILSSKRKKEI